MTDKILFTDKERVESNQSILDELEARVTRIEEKIDKLTNPGGRKGGDNIGSNDRRV